MVGGAPVAQPADVHRRLAVLGDTRRPGLNVRGLRADKGQQLRSAGLLAEHLTQQGDGAAEILAEHAVHAGPQGDDRHTHLLLQGFGLICVLILGDNDIRRTGQDLLRLRRLGVGAAHAAGGQGGEGIAVHHHIGPRHTVEHLGTLLQRGVVDVLHAAQQAHVAHIAV